MTPQEVKDYYKTFRRFRDETGMSFSNLTYWFKKGYVPVVSQAKIHRLTKGKLKVDLDLTIENEETKE